MARAAVGIVTQIKGIDVETVTELRKQLRESRIEFRVIKNTLAKRAAKGTPDGEPGRGLQGPGGLAFSYSIR